MKSSLIFALIFTSYTLLPGVAWGWIILKEFQNQDHSRIKSIIFSGCTSVVMGILISSLIIMILGETALYKSHFLSFFVGGIITFIGILVGIRLAPHTFRSHIKNSIPYILVFFLSVLCITKISNRGEWILGGWDPGVYLNEGVILEKKGNFHPRIKELIGNISKEDLMPFTRNIRNARELFPAIFIDKNRISFQFFRLFPSVIAPIYRYGGIGAAMRVNLFIGLMILLVLPALILAFSTPLHSMLASLFLVIQPIFLYHLSIPISEMLQLLIVSGLGWASVVLPYGSFAYIVMLPLLFFIGILNRFSFIPFASIFIFLFAWQDTSRINRSEVYRERILQVLGIIFGIVVDIIVAPISVKGYREAPFLLIASFLVILISLLVDIYGNVIKKRVSRYLHFNTFFISIILYLLVLYLLGRYSLIDSKNIDNFYRLLQFIGIVPILLTVTGGFILLKKKQGRITTLITFLTSVTLLLLIKKWIADIYPWATRRYLPYTIPLIAILSSYTLSYLWENSKNRYNKIATILILILVLASTGKKSLNAWNHTELNGLVSIMNKVAKEIEPQDIVIVDHPWWGTPLACIFGKRVLDGRHFYKDGTKKMEEGIKVIEGLYRRGASVKFLTSTDLGLKIYPLPIKNARLLWTSKRVSLYRIVHARKANDFVLRKKEYIFRLYSWNPVIQ